MTASDNAEKAGGPHLWIDADACPRPVRDIAFRAAARRGLRVTLVANAYLSVPELPGVSLVLVARGDDKADDHLVASAGPTDRVVTADVPLAARLVEQGVVAINPRGDEYTPATIGDRIATRDLMDALRGAGLDPGGGPAPFNDRDAQRFAAALDRYITRFRG